MECTVRIECVDTKSKEVKRKEEIKNVWGVYTVSVSGIAECPNPHSSAQ